jgi:hypothetical protein
MAATKSEDLEKRLRNGGLAAIAMSMYRNRKPPLETAREIGAVVRQAGVPVKLLLEVDLGERDTFDDGVSLHDGLREFLALGFQEVRAWTRDVNEHIRSNWPTGLVNSFDPEFSYANADLKPQALGRLADSEYIVRTDPGCRPPKNLLADILRHIVPIEDGYADLVCGRYSGGRFPIRTDFLPQEPAEAHREYREELFGVVEAFTRIVPDAQTTGGALSTRRVQGPPPPPFDGIKIVLSDDGFMKTVLGDRAMIDANTIVPRSQPGFALKSHDYRVRLCLMAALDRLWRGKSAASAAVSAVAFYRAVGSLIAETHRADVDVAGARAAVEVQIDPIARGVERYHSLLLGRWSDCLDVVASNAEVDRMTKVT